MKQENEWPEDKADWPQTASVVQGGVVPAKPAQSYGKTRQVTVEQLAKLQEQRDELLAALNGMLEVFGDEFGMGDSDICDKARAAIASVNGESPANDDGWISVLDRLPEKEGLYAVYLANTEYGGINKEDGSVGRVDYDEWGDRGDSRGLRWECEYIGWGLTETIDNPRRLEEIVTHWKPMQPPVNAPKAPLTDAERDKIITALKAARNRGEK